MKDQALCVLFSVGAERLCMPVADVHKVVGQSRLCRLPRLQEAVAGITHHRGRIVTVFDAGALLFGLPRKPEGAVARPLDARVLVLERMQRHLALAVDAIHEIEPVKITGDLPRGPCPALRVAQHRGQALFALDADRMLDMMLGEQAA